MNKKQNASRQLTLYYDSTTKLGKQALADAKSTSADVLPIDVLKTSVSGTAWAKLADKLQVEVLDLINQNHAVYKGVYGNQEVILSASDALKILEKHPEVLVYPIVERGDKCIQFKQSTDMRKLKEPDSKGTNMTR